MQRLAQPDPKDALVFEQLHRHKELQPRWHDWAGVVAVTRELAQLVLEEA